MQHLLELLFDVQGLAASDVGRPGVHHLYLVQVGIDWLALYSLLILYFQVHSVPMLAAYSLVLVSTGFICMPAAGVHGDHLAQRGVVEGEPQECKFFTEEKSQKDQVVTASKPSKPLLT